jgi:hypothetical protein
VDDLSAGATEYPEDLGYPAYQGVVREGGRDIDALFVFDFFGLGLAISPADVPGASTEKLRFAADVFRSVTADPGAATDQSAWGDPIMR